MLKAGKVILGLSSVFGILSLAIFWYLPVSADTTSTDIGVNLTVESCGDDIVNGSEQCDDGLSNGNCPASCSSSCTVNTCGGGGGPTPVDTDTTPPVISNVTAIPGAQNVSITWAVSDNKGVGSVSFVYGLDTNYGQTATIGGTYSATLSGLSVATKYYFKITATDTSNNQAISAGSFTTLISDTTPPVISNIQVATNFTTATISFSTNEPATAVLNYGTTNAYGATVNESGGLLTTHLIPLANLLPGTTYHFRVVATDAAPYLNSASSLDQTFITLSDTDPPPNVANLQLSTVGSSILLDWTNPSLNFVPDFSGVKILRKINAPASAHNDPGAVVKFNGNVESFTDNAVVVDTIYYYTVYSFDTSGNYSSGVNVNGKIVSTEEKVEVCDNGIDDDNNGKTDCADSVCIGQPICKGVPPAQPTSTVPSATTTPIVPITPTVPGFARIKLSDLILQSGNKKINLALIGDVVSGLAGSELSVGIKKSALAGPAKKIVLKIGSGENQFVLSDGLYYSDVIFPNGTSQAYMEIDYGDNQLDALAFKLNSLPYGLVEDEVGTLAGVEVALYQPGDVMFDGSGYNQFNPWNTDSDGIFGWMVPNGKYYLVINKEGYYSDKTPVFLVQNNVVNQKIELVKKPLKLSEIIDPNAGVVKNVKIVSQNLYDKGKAATKLTVKNITAVVAKMEEFSDNPEVEQAAVQVAPAVVSVVAISTVAAVSWLDLLSLLRFLFLQPLMLIGRKKREKWGVVYNSLTKLPVDLVIVRLFSIDTNRLVQSKVTDGQGRYSFVVNPGQYRLEVKKMNFIFPSLLLKDWQSDSEKTDIYHGEQISVTEKNSLVTANIPLDPVGENKTPKRLLRERFWRRVQWASSIFGLLVTIFSIYISPKWYMWALLGLHLGLLGLFRKLAMPKGNKGWGIVYDVETKKPISRVVARLFDTHFNKLVATEVTDRSGRYHFLAGDNKYYVTYERSDYEVGKTEVVDLGTTKDDVIARDVGLKKKK